MNRVDWLRRQFSASRMNTADWQAGYDDGLAGHRQNQGGANNILAYRKGWIEGNAAILQATVAAQASPNYGGERRSSSSSDRRAAPSGDRRSGQDRRAVPRHGQGA